MKLKNVLLGVVFVLSTSTTWAATAKSPQPFVEPKVRPLELGAFEVLDVTDQYPEENNYFDQTQGCSDGSAQAGDTGSGAVTGDAGGSTGLPAVIGSGTTDSGNGGTVIVAPGNSTSTGGFGGVGSIGSVGGIGTGSGGLFPGNSGIIVDQIINIGNMIWSIVQQGRPTMRVSTYKAHGLPKGVTCWTDLEEWKIPKSKVFTVEQKSKIGQKVAKFTFRISFVYGGSFNGVGQYLANVSVTPVDLTVGWGVDFASEVQIPSVFNIGKKTNPLAAMQVFVYWGVGNAAKMQQKSLLFNVIGDGRIEQAAQN